MRPRLEWLRILTPVILALVLLIVSDIRANVIKVEEQIDIIQLRIGKISERTARVETKLDILNGGGD